MRTNYRIILVGLIIIIINQRVLTQSIFDAIQKEDTVSIQQIFRDNVNVLNLKDTNGLTPLLYAIKNNKINITELLLELGAKPNFKDKYGRTALHLAVENGNYEYIEILLNHACSVNESSPIFGTPLHRSIFLKRVDLAKLLLKNGADPEAESSLGRPIHIACKMGAAKCVQMLIENGAKVDPLDQKGNYPIYYCINSGNDTNEIISTLLINSGTNIDFQTNEGEHFIYLATRNGFIKTVRLCKSNGLKFSLLNSDEQSLLHVAVIYGFKDLVDLYLAEGLDANYKDDYGFTPADYAKYYGHSEIASTLKNNGAKNSDIQIPSIQTDIDKGEAIIWMLQNRGWAIKTKSHIFIIDNENEGRWADEFKLSNGFLNKYDLKDQNVISIYSAYHGLGDDKETIHNLENELSDITFYQYQGDGWRGIDNVTYLGGNQKIKEESFEIKTIELKDEYGMGSISFLVKTDDISFYYSGFMPDHLYVYDSIIDMLSENNLQFDFIIHNANDDEIDFLDIGISKLSPEMIIPKNHLNKGNSYEQFIKLLNNKYPDLSYFIPRYSGDRIFYSPKQFVNHR